MQKVTVIIPAFNEEKNIDACIDGLLAQNFRDFKLVIIDDASTDGTVEKIQKQIQREPLRIELKQYGKVGPGRARNLAAKEVESEFIAFTDADCIPSPSWLEGLLKGFTDGSVGSVGGPHIAPPTSSDFQMRLENFFSFTSFAVDFHKGSQRQILEVPHNPLCNVMYRTEVFRRVGGFREDLFPGEDTEIDFKVTDLNFRILYNPEALVYHHRPESIQQFRKVMHAYGRAQGKLVREYGLRRKIQWLGLAGLLAILCGSLALTFVPSLAGATLGALILLFFFYYRPKTNGRASIFINALQWFNGFLEGLITKRSLPPGYQGEKT